MNETTEFIAAQLHRASQKFSIIFGYRKEPVVEWADLPEGNRTLMVTVVEDLINHGVIQPGPEALKH